MSGCRADECGAYEIDAAIGQSECGDVNLAGAAA
jgi:hypothetical protein